MSTDPAWKRAAAWATTHKVRTALLLLGAFLLYELLTIPWFGVPSLAKENPAQTAMMRQRIREAEREGKTLAIRQRWVPLHRISRNLVNAVIVAEDGTFYEHGGIDWFEVRASAEKNWKKKTFARGASTISQQLAKNLYLSTSKDPVRKMKEVVITLLLEHYLTKDRILELYLNCIEWGPGVFGAEAAARSYFGKSAAGLSLGEAARMAAVIPSPLRHRPNQGSRYVLRRSSIILKRMTARGQGKVPDEEDLLSTEDEETDLPPAGDTPAPREEEPGPPEPAAPDTSAKGGSDELQGR
jgi:monofunctional biosynthetic peptidoglycan transglycosylase